MQHDRLPIPSRSRLVETGPEDFSELLYEQLRNAPWVGCSLALHAFSWRFRQKLRWFRSKDRYLLGEFLNAPGLSTGSTQPWK